MITITPLSLSWCYTELGQGRGISKQSPVPFLVLHRVRAGEGCGFLGEMTIEQVCHFQPRSAPVPFLVLHRVRAGEGCRLASVIPVTHGLASQKSIGRQLHVAGLHSQYVARMLECDTEPVALLT